MMSDESMLQAQYNLTLARRTLALSNQAMSLIEEMLPQCSGEQKQQLTAYIQSLRQQAQGIEKQVASVSLDAALPELVWIFADTPHAEKPRLFGITNN